ncbi:SWI/SNF complex component SNF12-like protein [Bienertia sinuspersici]
MVNQCTSYPKFSPFFKKITINLDQTLYPDNHVILWGNSRSSTLHEGFEIKRKGDKEFTAIIKLEMNYVPERYKLSPALSQALGVEVETRSRIMIALWHYVRVKKLQDPNDAAVFSCDPPLRKVFGDEKVKICFDIPFPLEKDTSAFLERMEKCREIDEYDNAIVDAIKKINEHCQRRAFFLGFSQSPAEFVGTLIASQDRDLKVVAGDAIRDVEKERQSGFFNQPW